MKHAYKTARVARRAADLAAYLILYFVGLPWNLTVAWPAVLLIRLLWGRDLRWQKPDEGPGGYALACTLRGDSWAAQTWYKGWGGTTLGHGIFYGPNADSRIKAHEHVHVEQFEGSMLGAFILGATLAGSGSPIAGALVWWSGYLTMGVGNWLTAWLRGENPYRGSAHEESAYSQTKDAP